MKRSQRVIALLMSVAMLLSTLAGCGFGGTSEDNISMGQWLGLVCDAFGMESYVQTTPFFSQVSEHDDYFPYFQAAAEWGVIAPSNEVNSGTLLTWREAMISLINAGELSYDGATDEEKYQQGIELLDNTVRDYWAKRNIPLDRAVVLLDKAQDLWAHRTFTEKIEEIEYSEDVVDFTEKEEKNVSYREMGDDTIVMLASDAKALHEGDVYVLPANDECNASINKVKTIEQNGEFVIITNDEISEDEIGEYIGELRLQDTEQLDFSRIKGIYDADGNLIQADTGVESSALSAETGEAQLIQLASNGGNAQYMGFKDGMSGSFSLKVGDYSGKVTTTAKGLSVELSKQISKTENRYREEKTEVFIKTQFSNVELTKDIDYSWGKLRGATVRLDYKTTIEAGIKKDRTNDVGKVYDKNDSDGVTSSLSSIISGYKTALDTIKNDVNASKNADDEIYICRIPFLSAGIASVDFIVKGKITASGELKLTIEIEGAQGIEYKNGTLRYIKSKDVDVDFVADAKLEMLICPGVSVMILEKIAVVEFTVDLGAGVSAEAKAHLFDVEGHELYSGDATITAQAVSDLENEELFTTVEEIEKFAESQGGVWNHDDIDSSVKVFRGICLEWKLYPIVRIGLSEKGLVGKLLKAIKVSASCEIVGSKNVVLKGHIDIPGAFSDAFSAGSFTETAKSLLGINAECRYDYKPWDKAEEKLDEVEPLPEEDDSITESAEIMLADMRLFINVGGEADIEITGLPKGYKLSDLEIISSNKEVAELVAISENSDRNGGTNVTILSNHTGRVRGISEGTAVITISTKDKKHQTKCAVTVNTAQSNQTFNPI